MVSITTDWYETDKELPGAMSTCYLAVHDDDRTTACELVLGHYDDKMNMFVEKKHFGGRTWPVEQVPYWVADIMPPDAV